MTTPALILFAHGARDPEWANPVRRVAATIGTHQPERAVRVAFLEFMTPDLHAAIDDLVANGQQQIRVVPVFLAQGGHLKRDLPLLIETARQRHPHITLELRQAVGEDDGVIQAIAHAAAQA